MSSIWFLNSARPIVGPPTRTSYNHHMGSYHPAMFDGCSPDRAGGAQWLSKWRLTYSKDVFDGFPRV